MRQQLCMGWGIWTHDIVEYNIGSYNRLLDENTCGNPVADEEECRENCETFSIEPRLFVVLGF